ncbi:hypothetical protein CKAH01_04064 [Colletotrichum kahawae]|uniref:Uncharacterized protein n=1 Tax=Colletotrichum kahawae TaxID=34407 RepID=A0AAD9YMM0_COLKA|nr:hypothetical protein CKAH01_04064 [Colletotrichum kahawae]
MFSYSQNMRLCRLLHEQGVAWLRCYGGCCICEGPSVPHPT